MLEINILLSSTEFFKPRIVTNKLEEIGNEISFFHFPGTMWWAEFPSFHLLKSVVVVGGGIMGLGTAFHLSERGYRVTLLEKQKDVAKVASYINGAMICPSMTASWASLSLLSKVICFLRHIHLKLGTFFNCVGTFFFLFLPIVYPHVVMELK